MVSGFTTFMSDPQHEFDEICWIGWEMKHSDRMIGDDVSVASVPEAYQPFKHTANYVYHIL